MMMLAKTTNPPCGKCCAIRGREEKRRAKRRERQAWKKEIQSEM